MHCLVTRDDNGVFYFSQSTDVEIKEVSKVKIIPTKATRPPVKVPKAPKIGTPLVPVATVDFGLFSSFAPTWDSTVGSVYYRPSFASIVPFARDQLVPEDAPKWSGETDPNSKDIGPNITVEKLDLNALESIQEHVNKAFEHGSGGLCDHLLLENKKIIARLIKCQDKRFAKNPVDLGTSEVEMVVHLQNNLVKMLQWMPIHKIASRDAISEAMKLVGIGAHEWQGTLPPGRVFAHVTSKVGDFPPDACTQPAKRIKADKSE